MASMENSAAATTAIAASEEQPRWAAELEALYQNDSIDDLALVKKAQELRGFARTLGQAGECKELERALKKARKQRQSDARVMGDDLEDGEGLECNRVKLPHPPEGMPEGLVTGRYVVENAGVFKVSKGRDGKLHREPVCAHPILPIARVRNIGTGREKIRIAYRRESGWVIRDYPRETLAQSRAMLPALAGDGIMVTQDNSGAIITYLAAVEELNSLPVALEADHLGWLDGEDADRTAFLPYSGGACGVAFCGDANLRAAVAAIRPVGDEQLWRSLSLALRAHEGSEELRMAMAAAGAAPLVRILGGVSPVVHLHGPAGCGKSLTQQIAASMYGYPSSTGRGYVRPVSGTRVGLEVLAGTLHNLPVILDDVNNADETQRRGLEQMIYSIANGQGKLRGSRDAGLRTTRTWELTALTSGEHPITTNAINGGAYRRCIEVPCRRGLFDGVICTVGGVEYDTAALMDALRHSYGWGGPALAAWLADPANEGTIRDLYRASMDAVREAGDRTHRYQEQYQPLAVILTADAILSLCVYGDGVTLDPERCVQWLADADSVDTGKRGADKILGWIAANKAQFMPGVRERLGDWVDYDASGAEVPAQYDPKTTPQIARSVVRVNYTTYRNKLAEWMYDHTVVTEYLKKHGLTRAEDVGKKTRLRGGGEQARTITLTIA